MKASHGGRRPGAGQRPRDGAPQTERITLKLTEAARAEIEAAVPEGEPVTGWIRDAALMRARPVPSEPDANGWVPAETCDLCDLPVVWRHPAGGMRCGTCPRPGSGREMTHTEFMSMIKVMLSILESQQSRRGEYPGCTWMSVEIDVMHHAINQERSKRGLSDLQRSEVVRVERMAAGHSDYASKFALYCAELTTKVFS